MAAAATSTGPIGIGQVNTTFYVWGGGAGFDTIQAAVDFIRLNNSGLGEIQVVHGHGYGENIGTITGGSAGTIIIDNRDGHDQRWYWNGTNYVPTYFMQLAGFVAEGMPQQLPASILMGFSPTGDFGNGSGNLIVTADPTMGMPSFNLSLAPQDGTALLTFLRAALDPAGIPRIQMPETLEIYKNNSYPDTFSLWVGQGIDFTGSKGMYVWARPDDDAIDFQGETIPGTYDQTIRLNYLGGDVNIGVHAIITEAGDLSCQTVNAAGITAGTIDAQDATFETCIVNDSPVRTFANTADGPSQGMIWPEIGIPVSAGDHWQDPSINPASLAVWPPVGVPVSTGTAWSPSIPPATIPRTNTANTFTGLNTIAAVTVTGAFTALMNNGSSPPVVAPSGGGFALGWNSQAGSGETDFINSHGGGGGAFYWYNVGGGTIVGPTTVPNMMLDSSNTLRVNGDSIAYSVHATGTSQLGAIPNSVWMDFIGGTGARIVTTGPSTGVLNLLQFAAIDSGGGNFMELGRLTSNGMIVTNGFHAGPLTPGGISGVGLDFYQSNGRISVANPTSTSLVGGFQIIGYSSDFSQTYTYMTLIDDVNGIHAVIYPLCYLAAGQLRIGQRAGGSWNTGTPNINTDGTSLILNSVSNNGSIFFNYDEGTTVVFGNGASGTAGTVDTAGNAVFNGIVQSGPTGVSAGGGPRMWFDGGSSFIDGAPGGRLLINQTPGAGSTCQVTGTFEVFGTKTFVVPHPSDETKELIHACLEGPENGVYYRGEVTTTNGTAEIVLPDYFEPLTYEEERTVLLTQIFEDDDDVVIGSNTPATLLASRVKGGKFKIRSTNPTVKVYWEVKAVRRINVDRLEVERVRYIPTAEMKEMELAKRAQPKITGPDGSGTAQDREPQPETIRAGHADAAGSGRVRKSHKVN
jgi:hypothetical protein